MNEPRIEPTISSRQSFEPELVLIPAGEFLMGNDPQKDVLFVASGVQPQHRLYLPDYIIAKTPVTNVQYAAFVEAVGRKPPEHWKDGKLPPDKEHHPVVNVSWHAAMAYCQWLADVTDKPYRLPSEAEWEKAARGTDGRIYPWGNEWDAKRCNTKEGGKDDTTPVGAYPLGASPYGLLDMTGNVWEWTLSLFGFYPYHSDDGREDPRAEGNRVVRGGAWCADCWSAYVFSRVYYTPPEYFGSAVGFRVAVVSA